jgi:hypothetical protein
LWILIPEGLDLVGGKIREELIIAGTICFDAPRPWLLAKSSRASCSASLPDIHARTIWRLRYARSAAWSGYSLL